MEFIIAIIFVVLVALVFFSRKPKELVQAEQTEVAPYKIETQVEPPAPAPVAEQASQAMVESVAPAKKPRKPRAPKATATKKAAKPVAKKTVRKPKA
jgi:hypothetical protein